MSETRFDLSLETKETPCIAYQELSHIIEINQYDMTEVDKLRIKRQNILKCISLLNRAIRKRKLVIQIPMLLIMAGTIVAMIHDANEDAALHHRHDEFKHKVDLETFGLISALKQNLTQLVNQSLPTEQHYRELTARFDQIQYDLHHKTFAMGCYSFVRRSFYNKGVFKCDVRLDQQHHCEDSWEKWKFLWGDKLIPCPGWEAYFRAVTDDMGCSSLIHGFCGMPAQISPVANTLTMFHQKINTLKSTINKIKPDYSAFVLPAKSMALYYFLTIGLGEISPFAVIALTLLTHVFADCFSSAASCFKFSDNDFDDVVHVADEIGIKHDDLSSYKTTLRDFQAELTNVNQELKLEDCRLAVCMADKEKNAKKTPISLLFHKQSRAPALLREIFKFADLNPPPTGKERAASARHLFELGSISHVSPLHSFFHRLKSEKGANTSEKVQQNIYQYAGFVSR